MPKAIAISLTLAIGGLVGTARAESPDAVAAAEALFQSARALVDAGNWDEGCPKFESALALHASASTQINIARCHEHFGRSASAWGAYKRALVLNRETLGAERQRQLEEIAKTALAQLEPTLARLRVRIRGTASSVELSRDGIVLGAGSLGEALPIDPGSHVIAAKAPGFRTFSREIRIRATELVELDVVLDPEPTPPPTSPQPTNATPQSHANPRPAEPEEQPGAPTWAWVSGATGLVLIGTGIGFLIDDLATIDRLHDKCPESGGRVTCEPGYDYASDNRRKNRDFALFLGFSLAGTAALGASAFGIVSAKPSTTKNASLAPGAWAGPRSGGVVVSGTF